MHNYTYEILGDTTQFTFVQKNGNVVQSYIDTEDLESVLNFKYRWHPHYHKCKRDFYIEATVYMGIVDGKPKYHILSQQRFIMNANKGEYVDHISHNTRDNRKLNLRVTEASKNLRHRSGKNSNNKSGYRNVCWMYNKWVVQLQLNGKNTKLGSFDDVHEAGRFAKEMREKYYKGFSGKG
ncbi:MULTISPECIES: hypothetical protein [unclassified Paenibacillus]|uniref:hypothetical protein n=1 Tax=unclassified Paenibacillus TaxID=185978 RepID=UPI00142E6028|nr:MULTISPECIES: hypothetical protein [unclassified Paenibacillus]KAF6633868.1 hypothetical protein HFE01_06555 [Paenibacillus sp. EKM10P]